MSTLASSNSAIDLAVQTLSEGFLVSIPSETVYGLGADATNKEACRKIFSVKGRPLLDPLILHIGEISWLETYAYLNEAALRLADQFWAGPLTIILPKRETVHDLLTAGLPTAAFRMPQQKTFRAILKKLGRPIAAPSANPFGYLSPTRAEHVAKTLGEQVSLIIDDGPCLHGIESTIIDLSTPETPRLLRPGPISKDALEDCLGTHIFNKEGSDDHAPQSSPGQLTQHYSPHTPLVLFSEQPDDPKENEAVVFAFRPSAMDSPHTFWFSESHSWTEVAQQLFALLYRLDQKGYARLHLQLARETSLASAINDRLQRAAAKRTLTKD